MKNEYYIKKLWFTGPGIEDSPVEFINGLNIIHGANDTGKSWILDSFDFMCGLDHEKFVIDKSTGSPLLLTASRNFPKKKNPSIVRSVVLKWKYSGVWNMRRQRRQNSRGYFRSLTR